MPATRRWQRLGALPVLFALILALAASLVLAAPAEAATKRERKIERAVKIAANQKGDPYRYGAEGPHRFDCSGLTKFSFRKAGLYLPRSSDAQYRHVKHIKRKNARRGDLVFFHNGGNVYHVGILAGRRNGVPYIWHSPNSGEVVKHDRVWTGNWLAGTLRR